jgi:hypothetical protein
MNFNFIKSFENFEEGKFNVNDIEKSKGIYATIVKGLPDNNPKKLLKVIEVDQKSNEVMVELDGNIYYVDIENVEGLKR